MKLNTGRLLESLPYYIHPLIHTLLETDYHIYLVGGIPRDILLNTTPKDVDFAVNHGLSFIEKLIENTYIIQKKIKTSFLTVNYVLKNCHTINIAHFRKETYPEPAKLPAVEPVYSIKEDAKRRDFTINSIYIDIYRKEVIDPLNGIADLKKGILRVTYNGSFKDDPTRIFRAVRYKTRMNLKYDSLTLHEIETGKKYIELLTKERIINEFKKISEEQARIEALKELARFQILDIKIEETAQKTLSKLNRILPYSKTSWIFLLYPIFKDELLNWPITRKEKKITEILLKRKKSESLIKTLKSNYPFIEEILDTI